MKKTFKTEATWEMGMQNAKFCTECKNGNGGEREFLQGYKRISVTARA